MPRTWSANSSESRRGMPLSASVSDETLIASRLGPSASVERREVGRQGLELLRRQPGVGGHDARAHFERASDGVARDPRPDLGQVRARPIVAVVAELVTG